MRINCSTVHSENKDNDSTGAHFDEIICEDYDVVKV